MTIIPGTDTETTIDIFIVGNDNDDDNSLCLVFLNEFNPYSKWFSSAEMDILEKLDIFNVYDHQNFRHMKFKDMPDNKTYVKDFDYHIENCIEDYINYLKGCTFNVNVEIKFPVYILRDGTAYEYSQETMTLFKITPNEEYLEGWEKFQVENNIKHLFEGLPKC